MEEENEWRRRWGGLSRSSSCLTMLGRALEVGWFLWVAEVLPFIATQGSNFVIVPSLFPLFFPTSSSLMNPIRPRHMGKEPICGSEVSVLLALPHKGEEPLAFLSTFPMQAARTMGRKGATFYPTSKPLTRVDFLWFLRWLLLTLG
ncbi:hypothetical protein L3X38_036252 [Prunus dulcis]|uniref:Uncharacterized protein n=1 Tax=Prunus dulcis TaxID=3755 RepID=A0AAD4V0V9_PRUDU|nr:hypothetical protein L3X38_036252 [Prunus dulcis]